MRNILYILFVATILTSCVPKIDKNIVNGTGNGKMQSDSTRGSVKETEDSTKVMVFGLPIHLDSTDVLFHPVGWDNVNKYKSKQESSLLSLSTSKQKKDDQPIFESEFHAYPSEFGIRGNMSNVVIEDLKTKQIQVLTDKSMKIETITYLKEVAKKINKQYLIYKVRDKDYNNDGKKNSSDLAAYYVSNIDGTNFSKIGIDYLHFTESKLVLADMRYYFKAIEDVNKDGEFNEKDKYRYYYIEFSSKEYKIEEYFPLDVISRNAQ